MTRVYSLCGVIGRGSSERLLLSGFRLCRTGLEAETVVPGFEDVAVVGEAVEECRGHLGIAEYAGPFTEAEVGGDDHTGLFVEPGEQMEQECSARGAEGQV